VPETSVIVALASGLVTGASLIIAIGAQNAFVLRQGLRREHVLPIVLVCALSDIVLIAAGVAGVGALVTAVPVVMTVIRWAGALFLLGYAALAIRRAITPQALIPTTADGTAAQGAATGSRSGLSVAILTALALTWLNPHVYLDTVVLVGSLAASYGSGEKWLFAVGAGCASILWFASLGFGARYLGRLFARPVAWQILDGTIAVVMIALAVTLLVT
jgi:L-lysine exporter family protein LysE/ArgO